MANREVKDMEVEGRGCAEWVGLLPNQEPLINPG